MKFSKIFEVNLLNMKSSLFWFLTSGIYDQLELRKSLMEKKNLKKFYLGHCRLQVTCTVQAEKTNEPRVRQVKKAWHMSFRYYAT